MGVLTKNHAISALVLGAIELLCGILVIILSVVSAKKANLPGAFSPWWAGVVFAIPGIVGVIVGVTKNYCSMIAFMVLNIIAFVIQCVGVVLLCLAIMIFVTVVASIDKFCNYNAAAGACQCLTDEGKTLTVYGLKNCDDLSSIASMGIAIVVFLAIAGCISLAASIVGCCGTCCNKGSEGGVVFTSK